MTRFVRHSRYREEAPKGVPIGSMLKAAAFLGVAAAGAVGVVKTTAWLQSDDVFPLRSIAVEGTSDARAKEVVAYAEVTQGEPLLAIDLDDVRARVEHHPFVKTANVRRVPPDALEIEVSERASVALLVVDGELYLLDERGVPQKRARPGDGLDLPVITGVASASLLEEVPREVELALQVIAAHREAGAPGGALAEVRMETEGRPVAVLESGARVVLGEGELAEKMTRLSRVLSALSRQGKEAKDVRLDDDRRPERVAVRLRARPEMGEKPEG